MQNPPSPTKKRRKSFKCALNSIFLIRTLVAIFDRKIMSDHCENEFLLVIFSFYLPKNVEKFKISHRTCFTVKFTHLK